MQKQGMKCCRKKSIQRRNYNEQMNVTEITLGDRREIRARTLTQYDKGQILRFTNLPDNSEIQFEDYRTTINKTPSGGEVKIPDKLLATGETITAYLTVVGEDDLTTVYKIDIPVHTRTKPAEYILEEEEPVSRYAKMAGWEPGKRIITDEEGNLVAGDADAFYAIYQQTTYEEIKAAHDAGRAIYCQNDTGAFVCSLASITDTSASFSRVWKTSEIVMTVAEPDKWDMEVVNMAAGNHTHGEFEYITRELEKIPRKLSELVEDETHRTVTDEEKESWNGPEWDNIQGKPFTSTAGDTVKYIGNADELPQAKWNGNVAMVKISDAVLTEDDLAKGGISIVGSGDIARETELVFNRHIHKVGKTDIYFANLPADLSLTENGGTNVYFIPEDNCDYDGLFTVPTKGVWIMPDVSPVTLRINGYTGFGKGILDPTAMPAHKHIMDDIILVSPNGTQYTIAVDNTGTLTAKGVAND